MSELIGFFIFLVVVFGLISAYRTLARRDGARLREGKEDAIAAFHRSTAAGVVFLSGNPSHGAASRSRDSRGQLGGTGASETYGSDEEFDSGDVGDGGD